MNALSDFGNYNSTTLKVTYTTQDGQQYDASQIVHFSDVDWQPTEPADSAETQSYILNSQSMSNGMVLYPNPAANQVCVLIPEVTNNSYLYVLDMNGRIVKKRSLHKTKVNIGLTDLQEGLYIIRVQTSKDVFTRKLSIVH